MSKLIKTLILAGTLTILSPTIANGSIGPRTQIKKQHDQVRTTGYQQFQNIGNGYMSNLIVAQMLTEIELLNAGHYKFVKDGYGNEVLKFTKAPESFYQNFLESPCSLELLKKLDNDNDQILTLEEVIGERYDLEEKIFKERFPDLN